MTDTASIRSSEINPLNLWSSLRTELLWTYEGGIHPSNRQKETDHTHGYWVWLLEKGEVTVSTKGKKLRAKAGDWLVSPHGIISQDFSADASILSLHFTCQWPTGDNLFAGRDGLVFEVARHPRLEQSARQLLTHVQLRFPATDIHFTHQPARYFEFLHLQHLFIGWLEAFAEAMQREGRLFMHIGDVDERLMKAIRALNEAPLSDAFPADGLRHDTGLGRAHLDYLFLQAFGITTRSYWDRRRVESACTLLGTTRMPVKELGFRLGFKQASHFTRWFQRHCAVTPLSYRQTNTFAGQAARSDSPAPPPPPGTGRKKPGRASV